MKKVLLGLLVVLLVGGALFYQNRASLKQAAYDKITENMFVAADEDSFDPGPAIGSVFAGLNALYQGKNVSLINELSGPQGTIFIASRSLEWCPFCMQQMIQLQANKAGFDAAGISMVGITYDDPALQQSFIDEHGITIPILSDIDGQTFEALGILNQKYAAGDDHYGIPDPDMIVIDPQGVVVGKLFLEAYSSRVDSAAALTFAIDALAAAAKD